MFTLVCAGCNLPFPFPDETLCVVDSDKGCSQFCKPGYTSYVCSCAQGWKISSSDKTKCVPTGMYLHTCTHTLGVCACVYIYGTILIREGMSGRFFFSLSEIPLW